MCAAKKKPVPKKAAKKPLPPPNPPPVPFGGPEFWGDMLG